MKLNTLFLAAFSVSVAACAGEPASQQDLAKPMKTRTQHERSFPGKPSAPIRMDYELLAKPRVGEALPIKLNIQSQGREKQAVKAKLAYPKQLRSSSGSSKLTFKSAAKGVASEAAQQVIITPAAEGLYYVNIHASTEINGRTQHKAFVIPIEVGTVNWQEQLRPQGELQTDSAGKKLIVLPAKE